MAWRMCRPHPTPSADERKGFEQRSLSLPANQRRRFRGGFFFLLLCLGCHSTNKTPVPVHIALTDNNRSVKFTGLNKNILSEIGRDTTADIWENLIPVYRMPADTDMKNYQPTQHGRYLIRDSSVVFTPDTPFMKGKVYFVRYYRFDKGGTPWDRLTGQKAPGTSHYTDLIFKQ